MEIETSVGEIVDKLSILKIKSEKITDENKLKNIIKEFTYLFHIVFDKLKVETSDFIELLEINEKLWDIEDNIREKENRLDFDSEFIEIARSVYFSNDERFRIKQRINHKYSSSFVEEKSYSWPIFNGDHFTK